MAQKTKFLFFENENGNYEIMKSYYPRFYDNIKEMQAILMAQGKVLDEAEVFLEMVLNNMFIEFMDEENISIIENYLKITHTEKQSLEQRKNIVLAHFRGFGKISGSVIDEQSQIYNLNAETTFNEKDEHGNYILRIKLKIPKGNDYFSDYISCIKILDIRIPAHLYKIYEVLMESDSVFGVSMISASNIIYKHTLDITVEKQVNWYVDENESILTDEKEDILIDEEE